MSDNRNDLPAPSAPNFNQRLRETVQTFLGRQGNPLDRVLTLRDLVDTGVLKLRAGFQLKPGAGSSVPLEPGDGVVDTYEPDLTPPPTPGSMTVTASISHVMIEHDPPLYRQGHGHLRTRVYGKVVNAGDPLPTFADAAEIGQFSGTIYAQPSNPATTWRLWIKWETVDGVLSVDPAGGINGMEAVTGQDVALLLDALNGQITSSQLYADLNARINLIDGPSTLSGSVSQRIATEQITRASEIQAERQVRTAALLAEAQARGNAISSETQSRITADSALQSQINMLSAAGSGDFSELLAAIQEEQTARIDGDTAEATQRTTLAAQVTELVAVDEYDALERDILGHGVNVLNTAERIRATASLTEEQTVRATQDEALAQQITTLTATVGANAATLTAEQTARATADEALSSSLQSLTAKVNTNTASITAEQTARAAADSALTTSINYLQAQVNSNAASITSEATARANADSSLSTRIDTLTAAVNTADTGLSAAIQGEATARANADIAEAQARETLAARVTSAEGSITSQAVQISNRYTKAETDSAISSASQALSASYQAADAAILSSAKAHADAGILSEQTARANADSALASSISSLGATVDNNNTTLSAAIQDEATARANADAAVARSVSTLQASAGTGGLVYNGSFANGSAEGWSGLAGVSSAPYGGLPKAYAGIQNTRDINFPNTDASRWMACKHGDEFEVSAWVSAQAASPRYGIGIQYERTNGNIETWTLLDTVTAPTLAKFLRGYWTAPSDARRVRFWGQIDTIGTENPWHITDVQLRRTDARTSANTAAIQTEAEVRATQTGELYAKYGIKLDVNGYVTGWAMNNNGSTGDMIVLADRFAVGAPGGGNITPFVVSTTEQVINGVTVPAGTYMDAAYVKNGTITNAKIANLAVDDAKIANVSVDKLTAGTINVGQYIRSSNHVWGQSGWVIDGNGNAEFGAASIRGQLSASQINTEGLTIKENGRVILGAGASLPAQFVSPDSGWLNSNLVPSINAAATTASWGGVSGPGKPADGATSGSNLVKKSIFSDGSMGAWGAAGISYGDYNNYTSGNFLIFNTRDTYEVGNDFAVIPGETLYVSAAITTWQSQYAAGLGLAFFNSSGSIFDWRIGAVNPAMTGWNRRKGAVVVPAGAVKAVPWFQIDGPGGQTFPVVWGTEFYIGRAQEGATVGAPAGTLVGDTPAQDVESQNGAQAKANAAQTAAQTYAAAQAELARVSANAHADGKVTAEEQRAIADASAKAEDARVAAVNAAAQDASNKANAARSGAVSDVTPSINAKLSKAGDTISGRINFAVPDGMFAGSDTNNGVYFGKDGLVGRKGGQNTFYINTAGDAVFSGTLDAATMNSGRINLQHSGGWDWGYARSYNKWWDDGQNGWVFARHADGSTFAEMRAGSNRIWMSSWNDCGIQFPGITMTNGGLTISQVNVINTLQIAGNAVTVPQVVSSTSAIGATGVYELALSTSVYMDTAGTLLASFTGKQNFPYGNRRWDVKLYIDNVVVFYTYGGIANDSIALTGALYIPSAKTVSVKVEWSGQNGCELIDRCLWVIGAKR